MNFLDEGIFWGWGDNQFNQLTKRNEKYLIKPTDLELSFPNLHIISLACSDKKSFVLFGNLSFYFSSDVK